MKSRAQILEAIKAAKPAPKPLPEIPAFPTNGISASQAFASVSATSGSRVVRASEFEDLTTAVRTIYDNPATIVSPMEEIESDIDLYNTQPEGLEKVDVAVLAGQIGVAENGAVWVSEQESVHRVLPFIAQHLVLVLPEAILSRICTKPISKSGLMPQGLGFSSPGLLKQLTLSSLWSLVHKVPEA